MAHKTDNFHWRTWMDPEQIARMTKKSKALPEAAKRMEDQARHAAAKMQSYADVAKLDDDEGDAEVWVKEAEHPFSLVLAAREVIEKKSMRTYKGEVLDLQTANAISTVAEALELGLTHEDPKTRERSERRLAALNSLTVSQGATLAWRIVR